MRTLLKLVLVVAILAAGTPLLAPWSLSSAAADNVVGSCPCSGVGTASCSGTATCTSSASICTGNSGGLCDDDTLWSCNILACQKIYGSHCD